METILTVEIVDRAIDYLKKEIEDERLTECTGLCWLLSMANFNQYKCYYRHWHNEIFNDFEPSRKEYDFFHLLKDDEFFLSYKPKDARTFWWPESDFEIRLKTLEQMKKDLINLNKK